MLVIFLKEGYILYIQKVSTVPRVPKYTGEYPQKRSTSLPAGTQNEAGSVHERETKPPAKHFNDLAGHI